MADIIQSVVVEEMLHLTLVANILNGLGGNPVFDSPSLIPHYPGPLPGSVEGELVVGLAPCSIDLVKNTFMVIEQPEHPLVFPAEVMTAGEPVTIGQFYRTIRATIAELGDEAFSRQPRNQVTTSLMKDIVVVTDVASACRAIDTIIDQGEGAATTPDEIVGTDYAHYYRFAEILMAVGSSATQKLDHRPRPTSSTSTAATSSLSTRHRYSLSPPTPRPPPTSTVAPPVRPALPSTTPTPAC